MEGVEIAQIELVERAPHVDVALGPQARVRRDLPDDVRDRHLFPRLGTALALELVELVEGAEDDLGGARPELLFDPHDRALERWPVAAAADERFDLRVEIQIGEGEAGP